MSESYWEARARILAEKTDPIVEPSAPKKTRADKAAPVDQPPAVEPPADGGLTPKE